MSGERFPRSARLRGGKAIRGTFREGRRRASGPLELYARRSPAGRPRVAVVVPRHGHSIVERNRLRRRLREVLRREWLPGAHAGGRRVDLVVRARPAAYGRTFGELRDALTRGLEVYPWPDAS